MGMALAILVMILIFPYESNAANPNAPASVTVVNSSARAESSSGSAIDAQAGNITLLVISDTRNTHRWQGYYGNVSGGITLADAAGNVLFDWGLASPQGEIFASNTSTVSWTNITCFNVSEFNTSKQRINTSILENSYGMAVNDKDGINETFNRTYSGTFTVGAKTINSNSGCNMVYTYVNSAVQYTKFQEVILTDNSTTNVIFTAIIDQDQTGFNGLSHDFQMVVGKNGDVSAPGTYYFFVELG